MDRRWVYATLLVFAALLILGTGGFSAMSADRGVSVTVAGDEEAYLGYSDTCENGTLEITLTNQFDEELTDVSITVAKEEEPLSDLGPGDSETVEFNVSESGGHDVTVDASGSGVSVELDRTAC